MLKRLIVAIAGFLVVVVVLFLLIQLIPVDETNPPVVAEPAWNSPETRALAQRACFDCHSNETVWPAYAHVAPISWMVSHDTVEGRDRLNFSEWGVARAGGGEEGEGGFGGRERNPAEEVGEVIREGRMPPASYLWLHPGARLTEAEKQQLIEGLQASLQ